MSITEAHRNHQQYAHMIPPTLSVPTLQVNTGYEAFIDHVIISQEKTSLHNFCSFLLQPEHIQTIGSHFAIMLVGGAANSAYNLYQDSHWPKDFDLLIALDAPVGSSQQEHGVRALEKIIKSYFAYSGISYIQRQGFDWYIDEGGAFRRELDPITTDPVPINLRFVTQAQKHERPLDIIVNGFHQRDLQGELEFLFTRPDQPRLKGKFIALADTATGYLIED